MARSGMRTSKSKVSSQTGWKPVEMKQKQTNKHYSVMSATEWQISAICLQSKTFWECVLTIVVNVICPLWLPIFRHSMNFYLDIWIQDTFLLVTFLFRKLVPTNYLQSADNSRSAACSLSSTARKSISEAQTGHKQTGITFWVIGPNWAERSQNMNQWANVSIWVSKEE